MRASCSTPCTQNTVHEYIDHLNTDKFTTNLKKTSPKENERHNKNNYYFLIIFYKFYNELLF